MMRERLPFTIEQDRKLFDKLNEWIGDVFMIIFQRRG